MNVIHLAFPNIHLLTASYTSKAFRTEAEDLSDVVWLASRMGLPDTRWREARGPHPRVGQASWLRGNLGGIVCVVDRPDGSMMHVMLRDGTPLAIVRRLNRRFGLTTTA